MRLFTAALLLLIAACSPPGVLDNLDRVTAGPGGTRVASGVPFGRHDQALDVWRSGSPKPGGSPVLIFWHGGGWVKGSRQDYGFAARAYASRGFVVVVPDYRKVPDVRFPAFLEDGADAVKWTRDNIARFGGDPARIALAGHSAGAYTVAMLALDRRWLSAVGVDSAIVKAGVGLSGPYDFYPFTSKRAIDAMQGVAEPRFTQPIVFARPDAPPLMLVTSSEDETVRPRNAINLTRRLRTLGAPVVLRNYAGLDHEDVVMALSRPFRGKGPVFGDSVAFLEAGLQRQDEARTRRSESAAPSKGLP